MSIYWNDLLWNGGFPVWLIINLTQIKLIKKISILLVFCLSFIFSYSQQYSDIVDTRIGSKGDGLACGYSFIGACYPFGMGQFTPSFFSPQKGFVITQLNGACCSNFGNFPVLPINGAIMNSPFDMNSFEYDFNLNSFKFYGELGVGSYKSHKNKKDYG